MEYDSHANGNLAGEHRLTTQELSFVRHALDAEMLSLKKCRHYEEEMEDENARQLLHEQADIHHRHIDLMLSLLDAPGDITKHAKLLLQHEGGGYLHADG